MCATELTLRALNGNKPETKNKKLISEEEFIALENRALLFVLDRAWKHHLSAMDDLRRGVEYRRFAQKNTTHEYKKDSFIMFESMLNDIKTQTIVQLCVVKITPATPPPQVHSGGYAININLPRKHHEPQEV